MNKGFWNGFSYAVSYPTEIREIPEFAGELCRGIKDLKTGEMDRKHTLGFLVGGSINLTMNSLGLGVAALCFGPYMAVKYLTKKDQQTQP